MSKQTRPYLKIASDQRTDIFATAIRLAGLMAEKPGKAPPVVGVTYHSVTLQDARLMAAALILANQREQLLVPGETKTMEQLLKEHQFKFDDNTGTTQVALKGLTKKRSSFGFQPGYADTYSAIARRLQANLIEMQQSFGIAGHDEAEFFKHSDGMTLVHYVPPGTGRVNLSQLHQRFLSMLGEYHDTNINYEICEVPQQFAKGKEVDWDGVHEWMKERILKKKAPAPSEPLPFTPTPPSDPEGKIKEARKLQPFNPFVVLTALHAIGAHTKHVEELGILSHAIQGLSNAIDMRNAETLEAAQYEPAEHKKVQDQVEMQQHLAKMLLSPTNMIMAARMAGIPNSHKQPTPREKVLQEKLARRNTKYLHEHLEAREFLDQQCSEVTGLAFLLQAATLPFDECHEQAAKAWSKRKKPADYIIENEPQLWKPTCERLLDKCKQKPSRSR